MKTLADFEFKGKKVLLRADFNVPLDNEGNILDDFRIKKTIPTIEYLLKKGAKIILMSHLGSPGQNQKLAPHPEHIKCYVLGGAGSKIPEAIPSGCYGTGKNKKFSLKPVALRLEELLKKPVRFLDDCVGEEIEKEVQEMRIKEIILLENLRFHKEEETNDNNFARELAELGDIYINDAFSACHRAHASIVGMPKYLPSGAGLLLEKEVKTLKELIKKPKKPLVAIIGGKKVETKAKLIDKISKVADFVLLGDLLKNEVEEKKIKFSCPEKIIKSKGNKKPPLDIGPETLNLFREKIALAKTIFWSGPLGQIEEEKFSKGTKEIVKAIIESKAFSVAGGGETVEFINKLGFGEKFNHLSTGGGAMLAFLSGEKLPGIEALINE